MTIAPFKKNVNKWFFNTGQTMTSRILINETDKPKYTGFPPYPHTSAKIFEVENSKRGLQIDLWNCFCCKFTCDVVANN